MSPSGRTRGEGEQAKGDQTVFAVVVLAIVLVEKAYGKAITAEAVAAAQGNLSTAEAIGDPFNVPLDRSVSEWDMSDDPAFI